MAVILLIKRGPENKQVQFLINYLFLTDEIGYGRITQTLARCLL